MATPAEVKALFVAQGWSVADWARDNGFPANLVYRVLRGETDCRRGKTHQIGIALGIKSQPSEEMRRMTQTLRTSNSASSSRPESAFGRTSSRAHVSYSDRD